MSFDYHNYNTNFFKPKQDFTTESKEKADSKVPPLRASFKDSMLASLSKAPHHRIQWKNYAAASPAPVASKYNPHDLDDIYDYVEPKKEEIKPKKVKTIGIPREASRVVKQPVSETEGLTQGKVNISPKTTSEFQRVCQEISSDAANYASGNDLDKIRKNLEVFQDYGRNLEAAMLNPNFKVSTPLHSIGMHFKGNTKTELYAYVSDRLNLIKNMYEGAKEGHTQKEFFKSLYNSTINIQIGTFTVSGCFEERIKRFMDSYYQLITKNLE